MNVSIPRLGGKDLIKSKVQLAEPNVSQGNQIKRKVEPTKE